MSTLFCFKKYNTGVPKCISKRYIETSLIILEITRCLA